MMKETTCGNCKNLKFSNMGGLALAYCGASKGGSIVPHRGELTNGRGSDTEVVLWRVPEFCARPDSEVLKSEKQAPQKQWVKVVIDANCLTEPEHDR